MDCEGDLVANWDTRTSLDLQQIADEICCSEVLDLQFSVTIADPGRADCPLVACSQGFTELTGYSVKEIVGRNCRFLLDNVPEHLIDQEARIKCRTYIQTSASAKELEAATAGNQLQPEGLKKPWMSLTVGEILCVQTNAKKSGELFKNMFYMKQVELNGRSFILGLQAGLPEAWENSIGSELEAFCQQAFEHLGKNMSTFETVLARHFWYTAAIRRQGGIKMLLPGLVGGLYAANGPPVSNQILRDIVSNTNGSNTHNGDSSTVPPPTPTLTTSAWGNTSCFSRQQSASLDTDKDWAKQMSTLSDASTVATETYMSQGGEKSEDPLEWDAAGMVAPQCLHAGFDSRSVEVWPEERFQVLYKLQDAVRNQGTVCLMRDQLTGQLVATKVVPNEWMMESHESFMEAHPSETELPWHDLGCNHFLDSVGFPFGVGLLGVFRDLHQTSIVSRFAPGGDLFGWASSCSVPPGPQREAQVKPLARQLFRSVQQLHELRISHRDLSAENILLAGGVSPIIKVIDFGAASSSRYLSGVVGKPSYQAPEMFEQDSYDSFLSDTFALGVTLYAICMMDYPWMDTRGRGDKCVQFVRRKGFRAYAARRRCANSSVKIADVMSDELLDLLEGLLDFDPERRMTLGESVFSRSRVSVWDMPWLQ